MKNIGSPPGSNKFRLIVMVIIVSTLIAWFFDYTQQISIDTEKASIQQTKNIINSTLAVVFATYAVRGELDRLNELDGGNPFIYLAQYNQVPAKYHGETSVEKFDDLAPGWYYHKSDRRVIFKPNYDEQLYYFAIVLDYGDLNHSGQYESNIDEYHRLVFK